MTKNIEIRKKIIRELETKEFPNLKFLFSEEVLNITPEILEDFLNQEKKDFEEKLNTKNEDINFDTFEEESILSIFWSYLNHLNNVNSSDKIRKIIEDFEPKLTEFGNEISYSKRYFEMLEYCLSSCKLDLEQNKIISDSVKNYKIRGIALEKDKQEELKKINLELSELSTKFSNNVLADEKNFEYFLENDEFLKEFPESDLENAKNLYKKKKSTEGFNSLGYAFDSSASSYMAIIKYCSSPEIRRYFSDSHSSFASKGKFDNREIVLKLINLKNKKAKILGYKNYAELSLEFKMAESPEQVIELLENLSKKAKPKALKEIEEIKDYFRLEKINSWDMAYYSRILKKEKYNFDDKKLKQYFEFENTKKALFDIVKKLYGIEMKLIQIDGKYNENIEIYEVFKGDKFISYFIGDYFYNENKRSGAWNSDIRDRFEDKMPIITNNMSFVKNENGKTLLTLGEVETIFHEFGHAIHGMLSRSKYSDLSGYGVEWDFVELPSQLLEKWSNDKITIKNVAKHFETGESLADELINSLEKLKNFGTGNFIVGQNNLAIIDMMFHSGIEFTNVNQLDKIFLEKVNKLSIFKKDNNYKQYCSFGHIFNGGYTAGYYSYMWADIIVDEIWAKFKEKGVYGKEFATEFEEKILGAGSIKKASEMFEDLMGRGVEIDAFLKEKGLVK